jgi:hypothetical protein
MLSKVCETLYTVECGKIFGFHLGCSTMNSGLAHFVRYLAYISFSKKDRTVFYLTVLSLAHKT